MIEKRIYYTFLRYLIILALGIFMSVFYILFLPLTIYPSTFLLSLFYKAIVSGSTIFIGNATIVLVEACIAGSAYYLLLLLNLSVPMKLKKRIYSLLFSFALFLVINILRIFIFSVLFLASFQYFDLTHKIVWYALSGVIVFLVWIITIKTFKVKEIPFYTDLKSLYKKTKKK
jgi:exosortase/archaeosortase family protein